MRSAIWLLLTAGLLSTGTILAIPGQFGFQGRLYTELGDPLDTEYTTTFAIWTAETGGASLWTEIRLVDFNAGLFSVVLGEVSPIPPGIFDGSTRYISITVGGEELGSRKPVVSVPYSFYSLSADTALFADRAVRSDSTAYADTSLYILWDNIEGIPTDLGGVQRIRSGSTTFEDSLVITAGNGITVTPAGDSIVISADVEDTDWTVDGDNLYPIPTGNVGVGTTTPAARIDIVTATGEDGLSVENTTSTYSAQLGTSTYAASFTGPVQITGDGTISGDVYLAAGSALLVDSHPGTSGQILSTTGTALSWIDPPTTDDGDWTPLIGNLYRETGNIGIGLSSPARELHIRGSLQPLLLQANGGRSGIVIQKLASGGTTPYKSFGISVEGFAPNVGLFLISDLATADTGIGEVRLTIDNTGRVGIGTTVPSQRLDISDDLSAGAIEIGSTSTGTNGTIRYNGTYFQGYKTGSWHRLDAGGPIGRPDKIVIVDGFIIPDIQAGIDSLPDEGGVVYVPQGAWPITTRIVIAKSNVTIRGAGPSTIIGPSTSLSVVLVNACSNVSFEDVAFAQSSTAYGRDCVEITHASNVHFDNVTFISGGSGIRISAVGSGESGLLVEACRFTGQGQAIAVTDTGFSDIQIVNTTFDLGGIGQQAVYIDTGSEIAITSCIFRNGTYTSAEIWMSRGINISNNIMQDPGSYGLVFSGCSNAVVNSNTLKGSMDYGISFEDCRRAIVSSNAVGDSLHTMDFGLYITNSPQLVIEANGLEGANHGVYIFACADSRIGGNRTISTVTSDYTFDTCPRSSITGNLGSTAGFYISDSETSTISGNIGPNMDIAITDCPYSVVTGNNSGTGTYTNTGCFTCAEANNL